MTSAGVVEGVLVPAGGDLEAQVEQLHAAGYSQGNIADTLGVTRYAVRRAADRLGLEWNIEFTAKATAERVKRLQSARIDLAQRFIDVAHEELDQAERAETTAERNAATTRAAIAADKAEQLGRGLKDVVDDLEAEEMVAALGFSGLVGGGPRG